MQFPYGETVTFEALVTGASDAHGNPVETYASPVVVQGCGFSPGVSSETFSPGRDTVVTSPQLFIPSEASVTVSSRDRATVRGIRYEVKGSAADWQNPFTGWNPGTVVDLERVAG